LIRKLVLANVSLGIVNLGSSKIQKHAIADVKRVAAQLEHGITINANAYDLDTKHLYSFS
jgi:hypothetical protein